MEEKIKKQLIQSVNSIKSKIKQMKYEQDQTDFTMNKLLKPVADPVKQLVIDLADNSRNSGKGESKRKSRKKEEENNAANVTSSSIKLNSSTASSEDFYTDIEDDNEDCDKESENDERTLLTSLSKDDVLNMFEDLNVPYGVRNIGTDLLMGNSKVVFSKGTDSTYKDITFIDIDNKRYELTPGLRELLLCKKPDLSLVDERDKIIYKDMLIATNAHKRNFQPDGQTQGGKSSKYTEIIEPLFSLSSTSASQVKHGSSIPQFKKYRANTDLVYWDDPNELIDRLKILVASKSAGNNNHNNEILSIIEELKEAGIIKE